MTREERLQRIAVMDDRELRCRLRQFVSDVSEAEARQLAKVLDAWCSGWAPSKAIDLGVPQPS